MKKPDYVSDIVMMVLGNPLHISIPDLQSSIFQGEETRLGTWLMKAEATYCRNQKMGDDALYIEFTSGIHVIFHDNHMCVHKNGRKIGHFPLPLHIGVGDAATLIKQHEYHE